MDRLGNWDSLNQNWARSLGIFGQYLHLLNIINFLSDCSINYFKIIIVELSISLFNSAHLCFMYLGTLLLDAYMFMIAIFCWKSFYNYSIITKYS